MPPFSRTQKSFSPEFSARLIANVRQLLRLYRYWVHNFINACKPRSRRTLCVMSILLAIWIATPVLALGSDYGDAPTDLSSIDANLVNIYGSASHQNDGVTFLGTLVDSEPNNQPSSSADGDDINGGSDDEDGVTFPLVGNTRVLNVGSFPNDLTIKASTTGKLNAWIDWNQDGDWIDPGEQIATDRNLITGDNSLSVTVPETTPHGVTYARFRFSTASGLTPTGDTTSNGEVEDYKVNIALPGITLCSSGLLNGGFEQPIIESATPQWQNFTSKIASYRENDVPGWGTIPNLPGSFASPDTPFAAGFGDRNAIELWREGNNSSPILTHPIEGNQFAEINANVPGRLYQDFTVLPGTEIRWQLAHRGRQGDDTMAVFLGTPDSEIQQGPNHTTPNTEWRVYSGTYTVPGGQDVTRFAVKAVSSTGGSLGLGNFVDDVRLTLRCLPSVQGYKSVKLTTDANSNSKINPGDTLTYSLYYKNTGQGPAAGFQINDPLPAGVTLATTPGTVITVTNGSANKNPAYTGNAAGNVSDLLNPGALLDIGGIIRVDIPVTVNASTATGTLLNQGTAKANDFLDPILTDNIDSTTTGLGITIPVGSVPQIKQSSIDPTSIQVINSTATGNVLLVKRITAIHDNNTINPNDNTPLRNIINDSTATNNPYWPSDYLYGAANAGKVKSGDSIEYTVYFLNTGPSDAKSLRICDLLTTNQVFKNNAYGMGKDIQIQIGTDPVQDLTAINDAIDRARVHPPGATTVPSTCYISPLPNPNSSVVDISVTGTLGDTSIPTLTVIPKATNPAASPNNSYGLVRFKTIVP